MTTTHTQPTKPLQWNEKIDWVEVEKEKKLHNNPYDKKNDVEDDDEEDVDFDEKSARDEREEH